MDELELIRTTHAIDQHLGTLGAALSDERLKKDVLGVQARWRDLAYAITAEFCGVRSENPNGPVRRRGRRRKTECGSPPDPAPDSDVQEEIQ